MRIPSPRRVLRHPAGGLWVLLPTCLIMLSAASAQTVAPPRERVAPGRSQAPAAPNVTQPPSKPATGPAKVPRPSDPSPTRTGGSWIFLPGPNGNIIPVPANLWKQFLKWQATQQTPPYHVTSVTLDGTVVDDRAVLDARVEIRVNRDDQWVPIALRMRTGNTVLLTPPVHKGNGQSRPDTQPNEPSQGLRWWLKGRGLHELSFRLSVPVLREHPRHRLTLALPTPAAAGTRLQLSIPGGPVRVTAADGRGHISRRTSENGTTRIEVHGFDDRIDLSWRSTAAAKSGDAVLASALAVVVEPATESIVLKAHQRVRILKGRLGTITVDLPEGFRLVDVQGDALQDPQVDPEEPGRVHLPLTDQETDVGSDPIEIRWTLQGDFPTAGRSLVLDGFNVERARYQTGHVAINLLDNYRSTKKLERFLHRINVGSLPRTPTLATLFGNNVASAWEILRQPFRLELDLLEIEPRFVAEPHLFLMLSESRAELIVDVPRAQVFRGAVDTLEFQWPDWTEQGWQIAADESPELLIRFDEKREILQVRLATRQTATDGRFSVRFKARRAITSAATVPVTLPTIQTPTPPHPVLVVGNAINVDTEFLSSDEADTRPLSARLKSMITLPDEFSDRIVPVDNYFRLSANTGQFQVRVMPQPRRVLTSSSVVASYSDRQLQVTQQIDYQVSYARVGSVKLMVPRPLQHERVRFRLQADSNSEPIPLGARPGVEVGTQRQAEIQLDEDRLGTFRILIDFDLPVPEALAITSVPVQIPLVQSTDTEFSSTRFELVESGGIQAVLPEGQWKSELDIENRPVWRAAGSKSQIDLTLRRSDLAASHHFTVPRVAIVQVIEDRDQGIAQAWACFQIRGDVTTLAVRFPATPRTLRPPSFSWDGQILAPDQSREITVTGGETEFRLDLSRFTPGPQHLLKVDYLLPGVWERGLVASKHDLVAPRLADTIHVAETLWQVHLPIGQHLFSGSRGHTPQFSWRWKSLHFGRTPTSGFERVDQWLQSPGPAPNLPQLPASNIYAFTGLGPPGEISIRSISQWGLVLLGAGLALAAGLILLYIPRTRHVVCFLASGFVVALLAIWFAEPIALLLQPALLGLTLAGLATLIHNRFGRRPSIELLPLATPEDRLPGSTGELQLSAIAAGPGPPSTIHGHSSQQPLRSPAEPVETSAPSESGVQE